MTAEYDPSAERQIHIDVKDGILKVIGLHGVACMGSLLQFLAVFIQRIGGNMLEHLKQAA